MDRNAQIETWRPHIFSIQNTPQTSELERFQDDVLRPILKFQHKVVVNLFQNTIEKRNANLEQMTQEEKVAFILSVFQKDIGFRNTILGVILGLLTEIELSYYLKNKSVINRRISQMAQQRILSSF